MPFEQLFSDPGGFLSAVTLRQWLICVGGTFASYLIGSISFAWIFAAARGVDLREVGSGNLGATNVFRALGPKAGVTVFVLDVLKGLIPTLAAALIVGPAKDLVPTGPLASLIKEMSDVWGKIAFAPGIVGAWRSLAIAYGLGSILGHMFPFYLKFKGGKAVATGCGVFLVLAPLQMLATLIIWMLTLMIGRYVSLASLVAAMALFLQVLFNCLAKAPERLASTTWFAGIVCLMIFVRHRGNIVRLIKGTENRLPKPDKRRKRRRPARAKRPKKRRLGRKARERAERLAAMVVETDNPSRREPAATGYPGRRSIGGMSVSRRHR